MRLKIFPWLGQEFVSLSWENSSAGTVEEETRAIFELFSKQLKQLGLSLDHTVRTRMFTLDMETWSAANQERRRILSGKARSVSSSHIWPPRLGPKARVTVDLLAMFPPASGEGKVLKEYDPETIVLRRMNWGGLLFLSGVTDMTHVTFDEQFPVIIKRLTDTLTDGGVQLRLAHGRLGDRHGVCGAGYGHRSSRTGGPAAAARSRRTAGHRSRRRPAGRRSHCRTRCRTSRRVSGAGS